MITSVNLLEMLVLRHVNFIIKHDEEMICQMLVDTYQNVLEIEQANVNLQ